MAAGAVKARRPGLFGWSIQLIENAKKSPTEGVVHPVKTARESGRFSADVSPADPLPGAGFRGAPG